MTMDGSWKVPDNGRNCGIGELWFPKRTWRGERQRGMRVLEVTGQSSIFIHTAYGVVYCSSSPVLLFPAGRREIYSVEDLRSIHHDRASTQIGQLSSGQARRNIGVSCSQGNLGRASERASRHLLENVRSIFDFGPGLLNRIREALGKQLVLFSPLSLGTQERERYEGTPSFLVG